MSSERADHTARFMHAIAALSAAPEPVSEFGRLISRDPQNAVGSILTEITETVLRRELTFRDEHGGHLTLDVSERRILRVVDFCSSTGSPQNEYPADNLGPQHAGEVLTLLQHFRDAAQEIFVTTRLPGSPAPTGYTGVSVRDLQAARERANDVLQSPEPLERALEVCQAHASGVVMDGKGNILQCFGNEEDGAELPQVCMQFFEKQHEDGVFSWQWSSEPDRTVILAKLRDVLVCLLTSPSQMTECFNQLHAASGSRA